MWLPYYEAEYDIHKQINEFVDIILNIKKDDPEADTTFFEAEIDQIVYKLYGLKEEEIKIVEAIVGIP